MNYNEMNYLKREDFIKIVDSDKIWSKSMSLPEIVDLLDLLEKEIEKHAYDSNNNFCIEGRRNGLISAIKDRILNIHGSIDENILESLFNFWEFVNNEYYTATPESLERLHLNRQEIENMCVEYTRKGIICFEEKNAILEMIQMIREIINFQKENKIDSYLVEIVKKSLINDGYYYKINIKNIIVSFSSKKEDIDNIVHFALDIVNDYTLNRKKYDDSALEAVKEWLNEEVDDSIIMNELGVPDVFVDTELGATLDYGSVKEIGDHMPEVRISRDLNIYDVALNG